MTIGIIDKCIIGIALPITASLLLKDTIYLAHSGKFISVCSASRFRFQSE